jgi:ribulose-5-phosphate 4-epimerase/fuculose-1-phosphate aldolase
MYQARPEVDAIIHVHPTYAIAFSTLVPEPNLDAIPAYTATFYRRVGRVPMTDYYMPGSRKLQQATAELAPNYSTILHRPHGVTVGATSMTQAMGILEEIEQCCQIALLTQGKGKTLTDRQKSAIDLKLERTWPQ